MASLLLFAVGAIVPVLPYLVPVGTRHGRRGRRQRRRPVPAERGHDDHQRPQRAADGHTPAADRLDAAAVTYALGAAIGVTLG